MNEVAKVKRSDSQEVMADPVKKTGLALLREPFQSNLISKLPKPTKAQTQALSENFKNGIRCAICGGWHHKDVVHLDYVGHAALTDRLLDCDEHWNWEPVAVDANGAPALDGNGGMWIRLTVCGQTRLGYGHADGKKGGDAIKEVIGDALRNAAMRFGAALDLWHKGDLHGTDADEVAEPKPDPKAEHEAAVAQAIRDINRETSLNGLSEVWADTYRNRRQIADDQRVIDAKNQQKTKLTPPPTDIGDDEIPY
jgi:hypothetical protein